MLIYLQYHQDGRKKKPAAKRQDFFQHLHRGPCKAVISASKAVYADGLQRQEGPMIEVFGLSGMRIRWFPHCHVFRLMY
ncbi:hypothetical protein Nepgr_014966 [Nepenthes gracilis]|uniref:Uncharacterized protein n=1 Tax=Nepenthes gracilis TaxID=150966 RepID=A0AAD3XR06_NEPGR|nr:hypothetical protein Nepgr_014966 [Nepenthes gracilis]